MWQGILEESFGKKWFKSYAMENVDASQDMVKIINLVESLDYLDSHQKLQSKQLNPTSIIDSGFLLYHKYEIPLAAQTTSLAIFPCMHKTLISIKIQ